MSSDPWLIEHSIEDLQFLRSLAQVIQASSAASIAVDELAEEIASEIAVRSKNNHYDGDNENRAVRAWLASKKKEYKKKQRD